MNESVVEGSIDVGNAEYELALADLGSKLDSGFLCNTCFFWWLYPNVSNPIHRTESMYKLDCVCSSTCNRTITDVPSSEASEKEKLELGVVKVRELTPAIKVCMRQQSKYAHTNKSLGMLPSLDGGGSCFSGFALMLSCFSSFHHRCPIHRATSWISVLFYPP